MMQQVSRTTRIARPINMRTTVLFADSVFYAIGWPIISTLSGLFDPVVSSYLLFESLESVAVEVDSVEVVLDSV